MKKLILLLLLRSFIFATDVTTEFSYTGNPQQFIVPNAVHEIQIEVWGAQGGSSEWDGDILEGGLGGYSYGYLDVAPGDTLHIFVGRKGCPNTDPSAGWNGGACAGSGGWGNGGGGGDASDVRIGGMTLYDRIIVGGGGGGAFNNFHDPDHWCHSSRNGSGGVGGGNEGGNWSGSGAYGGTQTNGGNADGSWDSDGIFGYGGTYTGGNFGCSDGAGGGGGWYGGSAASGSCNGAAGGGSGYIGSVMNGNMNSGVREGHGLVKLNYVVIDGCLDPLACNYNSNAEIDDGSCIYYIDCLGECGGEAIEDCAGVCQGLAYSNECGCVGGDTELEEDFCYGCTNSDAHNYDSETTIDDDSCILGPNIISIYDRPEDQGGFVFLNWEANTFDILPNEIITHYSIYRYIPNERGWELLNEVPASYDADYGFVAPTIQTSIPNEGLIYETEYRVRANTENQSVFYDSEVVLGYSIDNIAPLVSSNFGGTHEDEQLQFTWHYEGEDDFSHHVFNSLNHNDITTQDTLISMNMNSSYDEHYVSNIDIHYNESISEHTSVHNLHYGANLVGLNVLPENLDVSIILESLESNANSIIGEGEAASLNPTLGWVGSLTDISPASGYWVKVDSEDILIISGQRADCEEVSYDLHEGANLISYCCKQPGSLDIIPGDCSAIVGEGAASTYNPTLGWVGSLTQLTPGKGYWLNCSDNVQFNWDCSE